MSTATPEKPEIAPKPEKTKVDKVHSYLVLASTALGVLGALGTGFVWLAANFCVGDVEIRTDRPVESLVTKVTDKHGQQSTFFGNHVQVMPGTYHLEIGVPDKVLKHADANVQMWKSQAITVSVPVEFSKPVEEQPPDKKHWWQFWKKNKPGSETTSAKQAS